MINSQLKRVIYRLEFPNGVHLGANKLSDSEMTLRADTLFSALCHEILTIKEDGIDYLLDLAKQGFRISDGFPFYGDEIFLPKPIFSIEGSSQDSSEKKLYKQINYIPLSNWNQFLKGSSKAEELLSLLEKFDITYVFTKIKHDSQGEHEIYNLGVRYFPRDAGIYFILQCPEEELSFIDELIYQLSFSGIGGKRKSGVGRFELVSSGDDLPDNLISYLDGNWPAWMSLTTSLPNVEEGEEILRNALGYQVQRRGGFISSYKSTGDLRAPIRKKDLFFLSSGSVFRTKYTGNIFNASPDFTHPVYQYGMPLFLGVKI